MGRVLGRLIFKSGWFSSLGTSSLRTPTTSVPQSAHRHKQSNPDLLDLQLPTLASGQCTEERNGIVLPVAMGSGAQGIWVSVEGVRAGVRAVPGLLSCGDAGPSRCWSEPGEAFVSLIMSSPGA